MPAVLATYGPGSIPTFRACSPRAHHL